MKLKSADHKAVDKYLRSILQAVRKGKLSVPDAHSDLAHAMTAAALGNEGEFKAYIRLKPKERAV